MLQGSELLEIPYHTIPDVLRRLKAMFPTDGTDDFRPEVGPNAIVVYRLIQKGLGQFDQLFSPLVILCQDVHDVVG